MYGSAPPRIGSTTVGTPNCTSLLAPRACNVGRAMVAPPASTAAVIAMSLRRPMMWLLWDFRAGRSSHMPALRTYSLAGVASLLVEPGVMPPFPAGVSMRALLRIALIAVLGGALIAPAVATALPPTPAPTTAPAVGPLPVTPVPPGFYGTWFDAMSHPESYNTAVFHEMASMGVGMIRQYVWWQRIE